MATIESFIQPPELYRYRSLREFEREIETIEHGYVYCVPFTDLNDPMEGLFSSSRHMRESEEYRRIIDLILDKKSQIGMCCFGEIHDHELMWAHYADQFRGICIGYNFRQLLVDLPPCVNFVRMSYSETAPSIHRVRKGAEYLAKMILSCKNYRWNYEREWRMFAPHGPALYGNTANVTSVFLGSRIPDSQREAITNRLARLRIKTHSMTIKKYSIAFEEM